MLAGIDNLGTFVAAGLVLNLLPGPDNFYIVGRGLAQGRKAAVLSAVGIALGSLSHTVLAALGLSAVLAQSALAFTIVKWVGALYLVWLGWGLLRQTAAQPDFSVDPAVSGRRILWQGWLTNLLNPKVALFFLAFLPQFIDAKVANGPLPFLLLGTLFTVNGLIWCLMLAFFSAEMGRYLRRSQTLARWLNRLTGWMFIGLAVNLLRTNLKHSAG
ncbi:LysE family translocator [Parachitinimonas caeni]|uniref:LysE family translocator n=1 Tax=Parachitinimonas caeni TaxID=3031301 RepID=A0ABT7DXU5_9NEIS|nr:LysE family translocator [Parachitinimonas caeni]MDK2124890.1 LysE family translocator [Parachitinimonas caeni]